MEKTVDAPIQYLLNVVEVETEIQKIVLPVCHDDILIDILNRQRLRRELKGVLRLKPGHVLFQTLETIFGGVPFCQLRHGAPPSFVSKSQKRFGFRFQGIQLHLLNVFSIGIIDTVF